MADRLGSWQPWPPAHHVQAAFAGLGIVADDREGVGWRDIPPGAMFGAGRCGGIAKTSLISLTSEERRAGHTCLERNWPAGPRRPGRRQAVYDSSVEAVTAVEGFWGH